MRLAPLLALSTLSALFVAPRALAQVPSDPPPLSKNDDTYGRIDGDLAVVAGAGVTVGPRNPRGTIDLRLRYLDTAGIFATYEDGKIFGDGAEPVRVLAGGIELRPLFIGRWLTGREFGSARGDLLLDSFGLEIGGFFAQPQGGSLGSRPGLQLGLGLEVPVLAQSSGPWIGFHGGVRWADSALGGQDALGPADRAMFLSITVSWHQMFGAHIVDLRDTRPR